MIIITKVILVGWDYMIFKRKIYEKLLKWKKRMIVYIRQCFEKKVPLEDKLHNKAMLLYRQYMVVGGIPQSEYSGTRVHAVRA